MRGGKATHLPASRLPEAVRPHPSLGAVPRCEASCSPSTDAQRYRAESGSLQSLVCFAQLIPASSAASRDLPPTHGLFREAVRRSRRLYAHPFPFGASTAPHNEDTHQRRPENCSSSGKRQLEQELQ